MKRDLFVIVADLDAENTICSLLSKRQEALGVQLAFDRPLDLLRFNGRDAGCRKNAVELLRVAQRTHRHGILLFDHHGCGDEKKSHEEIETEIEKGLVESGWSPKRIAVILFYPELEVWAWSNSVRMADIMGWDGDVEALKEFIKKKRFMKSGAQKPDDPKGAMRAAMRFKNVPCTARVFSALAENVSVRGCTDCSFNKFVRVLREWFSVNEQ